LITNKDGTPQEIYEMYKIRGEIEQIFDTLKNILKADSPYMQDEEIINGPLAPYILWTLF
jgi:transposase